jgi:hypothetical protein
VSDYDRRHVLAQWGGDLPGGEIWSNSVRLAGSEEGANSSVPSHDDMLAWLNGPAKDAVSAFHASADAQVHASAKLTFLKLNAVDIHGRYIEPNTMEYIYPTPVAGGTSFMLHPNQCTLVVAWTTGLSRGPAHRGRIYLPLPGMSVQSDGRISAGNAGQVASAAAIFIKALADQPGLDAGVSDMRAVVMSRRAGTPDTHEITGVDVGRVIDTQRRRRAELAEDYQHAPVAQ